MAAGRSEVLVSADARSSEAEMGSNATDEPGLTSRWSRKRFVIDGFRRSVTLSLALQRPRSPRICRYYCANR